MTPRKKITRPTPSTTPDAQEVAATRVHPLAVNRALVLAGGDRGRLRFVDERTVLVVNDRRVANRPAR